MLATAQPPRPQLPCTGHSSRYSNRRWPRQTAGGRPGVQARAAAAAAAAPAAAAGALAEGDHVVGAVVWSGPKGAKVLLPDDSVGFMPAREAPYAIRDALEDRTPSLRSEVCPVMTPARLTCGALYMFETDFGPFV